MTAPTSSFPILLRDGDRAALDVFGVAVRPLLGGDCTSGACSIARIDCPPGTGAPLHRHRHGEAFYLLSGQVTLTCGSQSWVLQPGDFAAVPPGAIHAFRNESGQAASLLNVGTPAGHELFFRDADALARTGQFTPESAAGVCRLHHIELVT